MTSTKSQEIADEYISSLSDLTINSKPLINMLTMLADDNVEHAPAIVQAVENHLQKVRSEIKLPVLYLIDSIVKNVNGAYLNLFTQNIVNTFCGVFEKVDENTRASMYKLRQTWNEVFPAKKLFSLDVRVQSIDPAWPITASPPKISSGSIHVNPRFLVSTPTPTPTVVPKIVPAPVTLPTSDTTSMSEAAMREQLLKKQRELLELQKQKIELELLQAKTSLEQQQRQLDKQTVAIKSDVIVPTAHVIPTTDSSQAKPVAPVVPSQATKQVAKQFPAAAASLLKNAGITNGPRIAPASSIAVASARPVSRDPRLKPLPSSNDPLAGMTDSRIRPCQSGGVMKEGQAETQQSHQAPSISTVLSDQMKQQQQQQQQQLTTKQANSSNNNNNNNKTSTNHVGSEFATTLNASNNDNPIATIDNIVSNNNNNKTISGNTNKEGITHRASQKKDPKSSSNNSGYNNNSTKNNQGQSLSNILSIGSVVLSAAPSSSSSSSSSSSMSSLASSSLLLLPLTTATTITPTTTTTIINSSSSSSSRGGGGNDIKTKDTKSTLRGSSSSSLSNDKASSASSKSSHRKIGNKTRSKQPQASPSKLSKIERDCTSPIRSRSRENDSVEQASSTIRISPQTTTTTTTTISSSSSSSSFQSSKSRKKSVKSRKRSPSPPYRIPRRNDTTKLNSCLMNNSSGLTEEEQSGSLIVSPPHPPTFKEIRANARQRNYVRRNKEDDASPDPVTAVAADPGMLLTMIIHGSSETTIDSTSKDEDLRSTLNLPSTAGTTATVPEKIEDLDLRVLPPVNNKRQSTEHIDSSLIKKSKAEKFDALFGNEDVDLRTLTHPKAGRPPTPPPPVISGEDGKDGWAKLKTTPSKSEREKQTGSSDEKRDRDRNKDRLGRPRLYNKLPDDPKERRRTLSSDDQEPRTSRRGNRSDNDKSERNAERNIEIIMKQAAEQLKQGCISNSDYNTLIQEVLHMSEDQKLRAAQRKEKETIVWEQGLSMDVNRIGERPGSAFSPSMEGDMTRKDHGHSRNRNGPRWQNHQPWQQAPGPWAHPPGPPFPTVAPPGHFNSDFRPVGPWQNPRAFGPIRPDYGPYHRGFNANMPPNPRLGPGLMGPMGGPNGPIMSLMQNGPIGPIGLPNAPPLQLPVLNGPAPPPIMNNGPLQSGQIMNLLGNTNLPPIAPLVRNSSPSTTPNFDLEDSQDSSSLSRSGGQNTRELPLPDPKQLEAIANDRMKSIEIDGEPREIRYYGQTGIVFMRVDDPREIGFQDGTRRILIDDKETILCAFNEPYKEFMYDGEVHRIRLGGPSRELYIDDRWYECYFGGLPIKIDLGNKKVSVKLEGPPPQVKIGTVKRTDLVVGKVHLILDARELVPVFVDAKPQIFEIDGQPQTLEFIDCLDRVLLNGRPFKVIFGGLPTSIIVCGKKHFFRFTVLPPGVRPGYVKIVGMRGEPPKEYSQDMIQECNAAAAAATAMLSVHSSEHDSGSQDSMELPTTTSSELQVSTLSTTVTSTTSPSTSVSYKAETTESTAVPAVPALTLPLNMTELFARLVETGIVPNLTEQKKPDEEQKKEPAILPVSFDKPETLKVKQPAIASALYSGIQCSSCGARFAPELATRYSHHLDWHFRQNRRERDSARKAHSRPWYYDVSDWIQFEEIEDLEDRAQSWFETEKQSAETEGAATEDSPQETIQPSVPTGSDEDSRCQVCHDTFEQFYNEEKEEWHLRPTVIYEAKNYHPMCLDDYKRSLEKSALALEEEEKKAEAEESAETAAAETKLEEGEPEKEKTEESTDDKPSEEKSSEEKSSEEKMSEDKEEVVDENVEKGTSEETIVTAADNESEDAKIDEVEKPAEGEDVEKIEEEKVDEEKIDDEVLENTFENVKIKEEPVDATEMEECEDGFEFGNVEVKQEPTDPEPDLDESMLAETAVVDTTHTAVKSSIDGNVELESRPTAIPAAPSRIKINITKPLNTKEPEEPKEKPTTENTPEESAAPLVPASLKPALQGRKLSNLPPIEKGHELSGLCSIM